MNLYELLTVDFKHKDARGVLTQLVHGGYKQVNVLQTNKGVKRGGHYHKVCREAFYVICGCVEVSFEYHEMVDKVIFNPGDFFLVNSLVIHSMYFPENCTMVQMYDFPVEIGNGEMDIYSKRGNSNV